MANFKSPSGPEPGDTGVQGQKELTCENSLSFKAPWAVKRHPVNLLNNKTNLGLFTCIFGDELVKGRRNFSTNNGPNSLVPLLIYKNADLSKEQVKENKDKSGVYL